MSESKYVAKTKRPAQKLARVIEEAGELIAAYGKAQRWGMASRNPELGPDDPLYGETNGQWIEREMDDVLDAIARWRG